MGFSRLIGVGAGIKKKLVTPPFGLDDGLMPAISEHFTMFLQCGLKVELNGKPVQNAIELFED